jgi:hypothetical protein
MNTKGKVYKIMMLVLIASVFTVNSVMALDSVQNVRSTTHTKDDYSNESIIGMSWDALSITSTTVYYYYVFNTSSDYTIASSWNAALKSTTNTSVLSEDYKNSNGGYYFHIAAMVEDGWDEDFSDTTTTKGPYYIDTKAPSNVSISAPETTTSQVVTLNLYADGATQMYISNSGYGISGSWESYATSKQWTLTDGYETKTVYVLYRDAAGNATDGSSANARTNIVYTSNNAPEIRNLTAIASGNPVSAPNIYFDLYDQEGGDIVLTVSSANTSATTPDDITITGVSVSGSSTTYTISSITAAENFGLTLTIGSASASITSSVITLTVKDSGDLTSTATVTYGNTENLMVELLSFVVTPKSDHMVIQWQTASEIDTAGFILKRSETKNGDYTPITDRLIPSTGSVLAGASYEYKDSQIEMGKAYYYQLVEIDLNNQERVCSASSEIKRSGETEDDGINYDANGDGDVNVGDVIYLLQQLTKFQEPQ